jgi:hypothetical protein
MRVLSIAVVVLSFACVAFAGNGLFTVSCAPLTVQRSDPIVQPGVAGTHVHSVVGGNAFKRTMDGRAAENATATSCSFSLDHSNYWVPSLYHQNSAGLWELVPWTGSAVYYLKRACNYDPNLNNCDGDNAFQQAFPYGFRMVAGDPARRTNNEALFEDQAVDIVCLGGTSPEGPGFPKSRCDRMRAQVFFPSCWDGKNLDTPNHHDHVAYPAKGSYNGGVCPASHPVALFSIFFEFFFETATYTDFNRFAWSCGDATGYGFHGDFIMGWTDRDKLQNAFPTCNAGNCPTLGNQPAVTQKLIYPAIYEEDIGLNGPIKSLPGNNPVKWTN